MSAHGLLFGTVRPQDGFIPALLRGRPREGRVIIDVICNLPCRMLSVASQPARLTDAGRAIVGRARPGRIVRWSCGETAAVASIFGARFRHSLRRTAAQRTIRCTVERSSAPVPDRAGSRPAEARWGSAASPPTKKAVPFGQVTTRTSCCSNWLRHDVAHAQIPRILNRAETMLECRYLLCLLRAHISA